MSQPTGILRSGLLLSLIAVIGVALLAGAHRLTRDRIAAQQIRVLNERLSQVLPAELYSNDLHADRLQIRRPDVFLHSAPVQVFRARRDGEPVAAIMEVTAPDGYNGDIRMLVGILYDGTVSGVRVTAHRETPGLGDPIEVRRSDWIERFHGRSLADPQPGGWAVRRDGGEFDQFTGATITPRAVVRAVHTALLYFDANRGLLFGGGIKEDRS